MNTSIVVARLQSFCDLSAPRSRMGCLLSEVKQGFIRDSWCACLCHNQYLVASLDSYVNFSSTRPHEMCYKLWQSFQSNLTGLWWYLTHLQGATIRWPRCKAISLTTTYPPTLSGIDARRIHRLSLFCTLITSKRVMVWGFILLFLSIDQSIDQSTDVWLMDSYLRSTHYRELAQYYHGQC